jgi:hypothetical protein
MRFTIATVFAVVISLAALADTSEPAAASTINYQITFAAGSFDRTPSAPTPNIALGQFNIALDTSVDTPSQTAGIALDFLNVTFDSPLSYTYFKSVDRLIVGGGDGGPTSVAAATNDFVLAIDGLAHGTPAFAGFLFADKHFIFEAGAGTVHVSPVAATPVPPALPLFVSALGGLGLVGWRRRRA